MPHHTIFGGFDMNRSTNWFNCEHTCRIFIYGSTHVESHRQIFHLIKPEIFALNFSLQTGISFRSSYFLPFFFFFKFCFFLLTVVCHLGFLSCSINLNVSRLENKKKKKKKKRKKNYKENSMTLLEASDDGLRGA